jgi:histidine ammonia-lyase
MSNESIDGRSLELEDVRACQPDSGYALTDDARARMLESAATVHAVVESGDVRYGINTGFGAFADEVISREQVRALQLNLVRSHTTGVGEALPARVVRRLMLLKANSLAAGVSGIRPAVVDTLLAMLNADVLPVIPSRGSVGASGDLAPLAHLALALIGEGEATLDGRRLTGAQVLDAAGTDPVELEAKEGLALLNGTQVSAALAMDGLFRLDDLLCSNIMVGAMTVEGLAGSYTPFDPRIHQARNLQHQQEIARRFRNFLTDSEIHRDHETCARVQDPYSVRCMPQVLGAVSATLEHARSVLAAECNAVSDNPLIFGDEVLSGGNFHAEPLAFVADFMAIAATEMGNLSERRTDTLVRRVNPKLNLFLTRSPGLESGYMIAHVTAAALASENKTLSHPASVDTIPTSAGQEDHVSMAPWAAIKLGLICDNLARILAIELIAAAEAVQQQAPLTTTPELQTMLRTLAADFELPTGDQRLDQLIEGVTETLEDYRYDAD